MVPPVVGSGSPEVVSRGDGSGQVSGGLEAYGLTKYLGGNRCWRTSTSRSRLVRYMVWWVRTGRGSRRSSRSCPGITRPSRGEWSGSTARRSGRGRRRARMSMAAGSCIRILV